VIVVTGIQSHVLGGAQPRTLDPSEYLRARKSRKFMGVQDDLAVVAAGAALRQAGLGSAVLRERAGLYAAVGYIPFNQEDIAPVLAASLSGERFSMQRFAAGGFQCAHPLLTFRCLPNMPAYHVSTNFDIQGPYFVTYPGPAQFYAALEEAKVALDDGEVDVAVVCAVAHQRNFLVARHVARLSAPVEAAGLCDAGACVVLERAESAAARGARALAELCCLELSYELHDPVAAQQPEREQFEGAAPPSGQLGPAALLCALASAWQSEPSAALVHRLQTRDHVTALSEWRGRA
jgi:3-oxoacyl-(acyl-carrier-protein) synthase